MKALNNGVTIIVIKETGQGPIYLEELREVNRQVSFDSTPSR